MLYEKNDKAIQKLYEEVVKSGRIFNENKDIWSATIVLEVRKALLDWVKNTDFDGVLIGGCALGVHTKPRSTTDADILYLGGESSLPKIVTGFKKTRPHALEHLRTGVEIETFTPEYLKLPSYIIDYVRKNFMDSGGIKIASKNAMIVLKSQRLLPQDKADIFALFQTMQENNIPLDTWNILNDGQKAIIQELWSDSKNNTHELIDYEI